MEVSAIHPNPVVSASAQPVPEIAAENRELVAAVRAVNAAGMFGPDSELNFVMDRETNRLVVRLVDRKTQEVIRQTPAEYILRLAEQLKTK